MTDAGASNGTGGEAGKPRPTIIGPALGRPRKAAKAASVQPVPQPPARAAAPGLVVTVPTAIPGTRRERIALAASDIARLSPGVAPAVAERAVRLVEGFVVDGARERDAVMWGHAAQAGYGDLVSRTLELSQSDVLGRVRAHVGRMTDLLGAIDLEAVLGVAPAGGLIDRFLKRTNERVDTRAELDRARDELDQLVGLCGASLEPLLTLKEALERQSRRIDATGDEVEAAALAATFLSEHLRETQPALSRRFLERGMNLTQTALQIRGSTSLREGQVEQPLRLIAAIQDVALVSLPGWLGGLASLLAASAGGRPPTPTQAGELAHQLRTLLQRLRT